MISGFTFVKNGVQFNYPFLESIRSLLPLVDELIVNVGQGEDATLARVQELACQESKIKIIESIWDEQVRAEGRILAQQTDIALRACSGKWGIYLQADEVLHEADYARLSKAMKQADAAPQIDGLLFDYIHFYGSYSVINRNPSAYRHEVRAIKLGRGIESYRDAQGFRMRSADGLKKLNVAESGARIFHYGWVRPQEIMQVKTKAMDRLYHGDNSPGTGENYRYKRILGLEEFRESHPQVMQEQIVSGKSWEVNLLSAPLVFTFGDIRKFFTYYWEKLTGHLPFEYRNYRRVAK